MLKIEQLQLLIMLSKTGSIHKAADNMFVSQPALSNSLKKLEAELGICLFERTSKGLVPTKIGNSMIILAEKIIQDVNEFYTTANSFKWNSIALTQQKEIYLHTEEFFFNYYLSDFFISIQALNSSLQIQIIKESENLKKIPSNCPNNHFFIFLEEKSHPLTLPDTFTKHKIVDMEYAIKTTNLCPLHEKTIIDESKLFFYPYAHVETKTKFFNDFYKYLSSQRELNIVFSSASPMMIINYIVNRPSWTIGILFDQQIPKKEFFASAAKTKTIKLQTQIPQKYQITLATHQNASEEIINLLLHMIHNELIVNIPKE